LEQGFDTNMPIIRRWRDSTFDFVCFSVIWIWRGNCSGTGVTTMEQAFGEAVDLLFQNLPEESPRKTDPPLDL
jgi:hypothetical protein